MKKKIWIPIVIVLIAVLFIPIPSGVCQDGGTREYTALTYKIVKWNRLTGDSTYDKLRVYLFPNNFKSIDSLWTREKDIAEHSFTATVLEVGESSALVQPVSDSAELKSSDKISFGISELEKLDVEVGSVVKVTYTGEIMESYPARIMRQAGNYPMTFAIWSIPSSGLIKIRQKKSITTFSTISRSQRSIPIAFLQAPLSRCRMKLS